MLPVGLLTSDGQLHRGGVMRLATALDEIEPIGDERVKRNEAYFGLLLLARVVTRLGPFSPVTPEVIAALPAADYTYLQSLYANMNGQAMSGSVYLTPQMAPAPAAQAGYAQAGYAQAAPYAAQSAGPSIIETECPHCGALLELNLQEGEEAV